MKKYIGKISLVLVLIPLAFSSCLDSDYTPPDYDAMLAETLGGVDKVQLAKDIEIVDDSLDLWEVENVKIEPRGGVRYTIQQLGTGEKPLLKSYIAVAYKARFLKEGPESLPFDQSTKMETELWRLVSGWQLTLPLLPKGTKATLYIPSGLGYGSRAINDDHGDPIIPANSNLIFEIEILDVYTPQD